MKDIPVPRALSTAEVRQAVGEYRNAARQAIAAGADGVEIHGIAYLIHQFLALSANQRTDAYGGSLENRARFAIEVAEAVAEEIGPDRTGIRLSPGFAGFGLDHGDEGPSIFRYLVGELDKLELTYLHVVHYGADDIVHDFRRLWGQSLIVNRPDRKREDIGKDVASGLADLESYGQFTLANPDLIERLVSAGRLNSAERDTYFGASPSGYAAGYTDYPMMTSNDRGR